MLRVIRKLFGLFALLAIGLCWPSASHAACSGSSPNYTAASASSTDVQACLTVATHCGDIVTVPSGSATWSTQVTMTPPTGCAANQGLTLSGATVCNGTPGVQVSSCTDNTNITISVDQGFAIGTCSNTAFCTVTGFTFIAGVAAGHSLLDVTATHLQVSFRIHHVHFTNSIAGGVLVGTSDGFGLIDHYLVDDTSGSTPATPLNVYGDYNSRGYQDWEDATNPGSNQAVYVEDSRDNSTNMSTSEGFFDGYSGCKVVIRYTLLNGNQLGGWHGTDSGQYRGCVWGEMYNDSLSNSSGTSAQVMNIRSGALLFFNNTVGGSTSWNGISLNYYRISQQVAAECGTWGCVGTGGLDWTPLSTTITSYPNAYLVTLNAADWQSSHSYSAQAVVGPTANNSGAYNFQAGGNCTSGSSEPNWASVAVGSTVSDNTCTWTNVGGSTAASPAPGTAGGFCAGNPDTPASANSTCNALSPGDTATRHFDSNGGAYPFRDQPCVIHNQIVYGCYAWNNTLPGSLSSSGLLGGDSSAVQAGRDYFNAAGPPAGYAPYTYPHPLNRSGAPPPPPAAPTNLSAVVK